MVAVMGTPKPAGFSPGINSGVVSMSQKEPTFEELCAQFAYVPRNRPLSAAEVSELIGVHPVTVDQWRLRGTGPRYFNPKGTRRCWYSEVDVLAWLASGEKQSTSDTAA